MAATTFSGQADTYALEVAEEVVCRERAVLPGHCRSGEIVGFARSMDGLPPTEASQPEPNGIETMKTLARKHADSPVSHMADEEIRELIAARCK